MICLQVVLGSGSQLLSGAEETAADVHNGKWQNPSWRILKASAHHCQEWSWFRQVHLNVARIAHLPFKFPFGKGTRIESYLWELVWSTVLVFCGVVKKHTYTVMQLVYHTSNSVKLTWEHFECLHCSLIGQIWGMTNRRQDTVVGIVTSSELDFSAQLPDTSFRSEYRWPFRSTSLALYM